MSMETRPRHLSRRSFGALFGAGLASALLPERTFAELSPLAALAGPPVWDELLDDLHRRTFSFFWRATAPAKGLTPDAWPHPIFSSIAAIGFNLTALCIGAKSGYVTRAEAAQRTHATLEFLWSSPQGDARRGISGDHGFFYHFLDLDSGLRFRDVELSTIDTTMLVLGALTSAAFFDQDTPQEARIRKLGLDLYQRLDWDFFIRKSGMISMGWHPEDAKAGHPEAGLIARNWDRYNEGMMLLLLSLGREQEPHHSDIWRRWSETLAPTFGPNFGEPHLGFSPLFGHQYSHCWFDFRDIADPFMAARGLTYFENSRRAVYAQRRYAILNPGGFRDYGAEIWGLSASQGPGDFTADVAGRSVRFHGYAARGPQTGDGESIDDGTLAPTAGVASIAFAPEIVVPLIHSLKARYGDDIYQEFGFLDAFNPSVPPGSRLESGRMTSRAGWVADQYLGIDQGPILIMLENHRSGFVWDLFCRSPLTGPIARRAFRRAGFQATGPGGHWLQEPS